MSSQSNVLSESYLRSQGITAIPAAKDKLVPKPKRTRHFDMTKPAFHTFDAANRASEDTR